MHFPRDAEPRGNWKQETNLPRGKWSKRSLYVFRLSQMPDFHVGICVSLSRKPRSLHQVFSCSLTRCSLKPFTCVFPWYAKKTLQIKSKHCMKFAYGIWPILRDILYNHYNHNDANDNDNANYDYHNNANNYVDNS